MWKFGTLTVSPFNWLEASYFYYRPSDLTWGGVPGLYLDKGFNVKFIYRSRNRSYPNLAIGLDDFAGTGYFTREYLVATHRLSNINYTLGMGWGKFNGSNKFPNPLKYISDGFTSRPSRSDNYSRGGTPSFDKWFRGDIGIFGGFEYSFTKIRGLSMKMEYDPFDYSDFSAQNRDDASYFLRKKDSNVNLGLNYPLNDYLQINASYIKGNTFNLSFTIGATFDEKLRTKPKFNPTIRIKKDSNKSELAFYEDLLFNLNNNNLLLQTASISKKKLNISISTSQHRNSIRSAYYAATVAKNISQEYPVKLNQINISHLNTGIELNNITFVASHLDNKETPIEIIERYTKLDSGNMNSYKSHKFKPNVKFPVLFTSFSPAVVSYLGNPEKFYFGGLDITNASEIQFNRNTLLSSQINYSLYNNFKDATYQPDSNMEHVRTDKVLYLQNVDLYIKRLQLDYIWSPKKNLYAKLSGGIFEDMFGGIGGQLLFKPFDSNLNVSIEGFYVKQRDYDQKLKFRDYQTTTAHINIGYLLPLGIDSNISFGRYLALDQMFLQNYLAKVVLIMVFIFKFQWIYSLKIIAVTIVILSYHL